MSKYCQEINSNMLFGFLAWLLVGHALAQDLPTPRIVILGQTGAGKNKIVILLWITNGEKYFYHDSGKSTLANVLLGDAPNCKNCTFPICTGQQSCTKQTKYADGKWLGQASDVIVVDTPGFGDTENDDNTLIDEMMTVLKIVKWKQ